MNRLVGDFTSVLLVEADVSGCEGFVERARVLQRQVWEGLEHRAYGGVRVLRDLAREHGAERASMPVVFTSAIGHPMGDAHGDFPPYGRLVDAVSQTPQVLLDMQVIEKQTGLNVSWDAVDAAFSEGVLDQAFAALKDLLLRLTEHDSAAWSQVQSPPLPSGQLVVRAAVNGAVGVVPAGLLHEGVFAAAGRWAERDAVVWPGGRMSFGELASRAWRIGRRLREGGVTPGEPVVVAARKGWEQVVGVLGVLAAGGAYVPVDPDQPERRLHGLIHRTGTRTILTQSGLAAATRWPDGVNVWPVDDDALWDGISDQPLEWVQSASDLAYVIFTSGSTGEPKGVMIDHRGALNTITDINDRFRVTESDRVLGLSSLSFDLSVWDVFGVLGAGGALVLPDPDGQRDPSHWAELVRVEGVTIWNTVPALLDLFSEYVGSHGADGMGLRLALLSGDWIAVSLPDRVRELVPGLEVVSLGGATEASIWSIAYPIGVVDPSWRSIPYGRPLLNQSFRVVDGNMRHRPDFVAGELQIGGVGVAMGYWDDPERTTASFVTDPVTGERWYRTGDLGRYLADGTIEFLGREDFQVKIGGYRIELGEIEAALLADPQVEAAVAHAWGSPGGPRRLAAYIVPADGAELEVDRVRSRVAELLPAYMVPAALVILDVLPLTANGKVDRKALPDPGEAARRPYAAPGNAIEQSLADIWSELLAAERIGVHDNLFELGADSLLALRAVAAADTAGLHLELRDVFAHPTIAAQATHTTQGRNTLPVLVGDVGGRFEAFGLTDVQHAYWLGRSGLFDLGQVSTHLYVQFESVGFDVVRAGLALDRLVGRHEMLRAVVRGDGRQQVLEVVPPVVVGLEDLSGVEGGVAAGRVAAVRDELSHEVRPADVWPLFEVRVQVLPGGVSRVHFSLDLLVADAGSVQIVLEEWALLYADPGVELAPLGCSFRDYVRALEGVESSEGFERARGYWLGRVGELAAAPELPLVGGSSGVVPWFVRRQFVLDQGRWGVLKERAASFGLTASAVLAAAYAEVLGVWAKSPRFTLNFTVADRWPLHADVNRLVGDFTSVLLVEADVSGCEGFVERARVLQRQVWEGLEHRAYGGVRVLRDLAREHGAERASMPVVFTSAIGRQIPESIPGLGRQVDAISQTPQVTLDHQVYERTDGLVTAWDSLEDLFAPGVLDDMFAAYQNLITSLTDDPTAWQAPEPVRMPSGQVVARAAVNGAVGVVPAGLLHEGVFAAAGRWAERDAVVWPGGRMSFGELVSRAWRIGRRLREGGVTPGEPVVVAARKGWEQVVGVLGVLAAGGAYVPVDPDQPERRLHGLIHRTGTRTILTQSSLNGIVSWPASVDVLPVDDDSAWSYVSDEPLEWVQSASDLAYVIFTSGSTGEPKGVMIDHRGALNTITDINDRFRVTENDRVLGLSSLSFDLSVWDVFGVLGAGGALVLPDPDGSRDPAQWADLLRREQVTVWNTVPALLELLAEHLTTHGPEGVCLRLALLSGDWIAVSLPDRVRELVPGLEVVSLGGATEASIWSIAYPIGVVDPSWRSIPYGRPLLNQSFRVVDGNMRHRPDFVAGELQIGGVGVAMGYWDDPERTAASFVTDPVTGERWYRTGDLGRYLADGTIEFLGREDFQVKIGGYRIELGEIEAALLADPQVEAAVAHAWGSPGGPRRLAAYIVPADGAELEVDKVRTRAAELLPAYMVPAAIVVLDALPLTGNGKVDRKALPDPGEAARRPYAAPGTAIEQSLADIWSELLAAERIGVHDNLFELGADSLLALRAVAAADTSGLHLELRDVFAHPTIAAQATHTTQGRIGAEQGTLSGPTLMTPNQIWFLEQDLPERHHWNDASFLLSLQKPLDLEPLRRATEQILEHHDGLRLRFQQEEGVWQANLAEAGTGELPLSVHAFRHLTGRQQKEAVTEVAESLQRSMNLADGPIIRLAYFDLGERPHCLLVLGHWLAVDHYSARILLEDLLASYFQYAQGADKAVLPAKTTSFPQWTQALHEHAKAAVTQAERDYWRRGIRGQRLRFDKAEGPNRLESLRTMTVRLDHDLTDAVLAGIPTATGTDILDTLCTALVQALPLADDGPQEPRRTLIDLERHGRDLHFEGLSVSRTVGRFSTITPTLVEIDPLTPPGGQLAAVHRQLEAVPQRGAGYGLLRHAAADPGLRDVPTAQVGLNYVGQVDEVFLRSDLLSVPRMSFGEQHSSVGTRFRDVDVLGYVVGRRLTFLIGYSAHHFDEATMTQFAASFEEKLRRLAEDADRD
ncbi:yersiniabactin nonribosomal peptide synthetase [Streptomyces sp. SPB162]|nr:yersiniabactin nonribosomal peptide synthetase [Streptomyces sp. SPB162]